MCKEPVITKKTAGKKIFHPVILCVLLIGVVGSKPRTFTLGGDCADSTEKLHRKKKRARKKKAMCKSCFENVFYGANDS